MTNKTFLTLALTAGLLFTASESFARIGDKVHTTAEQSEESKLQPNEGANDAKPSEISIVKLEEG